MKNLLTAILLAATGTINAQTETIQYRPGITPEGAVYFLPKTAIRIAVQVEKTTYTPGDFCQYAQKYLRINDVQQKPSESYKVTKIDVITEGFADKTKGFAVKFDAKTSATNVVLSDEIKIVDTKWNYQYFLYDSIDDNQFKTFSILHLAGRFKPWF